MPCCLKHISYKYHNDPNQIGINTGWTEKNRTSFFIAILFFLVISGFCLTHSMLCYRDIEEKGLLLLCISKWLRREPIEWKFLHFFARDTKWVMWQAMSECLALPSTRSRSAWTISRLSCTIHNNLSTTACTFVDAFVIVYALLDRVECCAKPTSFVTLLTLHPARRSAENFTRLSFCGAILKFENT